MSKPLTITIDSILKDLAWDGRWTQSAVDDKEASQDDRNRFMQEKHDKAKTQIEAMIEDIVEPNGYIGVDQLPDPMNIRYEVQRQVKERIIERATKYNLTLKEGKQYEHAGRLL